jgi:hypothetical protein
MKTLSIGLLAAVAIALAAAPADAATKKKKSAKKGKAEAAEVSKVDPNHPMYFTCFWNGMVGAKQPKACGG